MCLENDPPVDPTDGNEVTVTDDREPIEQGVTPVGEDPPPAPEDEAPA